MTISLGIKCSLLLVGAGLATACDDGIFDDDDDDVIPVESYRAVELVTDADDPNLINPWGIAIGPGGFWMANEGTGTSVAFDREGRFLRGIDLLGAGVTGMVANPSAGFVISQGGQSAPAWFIFVTNDGRLLAFNERVNATSAVLVPGPNPNAAYTGVTYALARSGPQLYAANFGEGTIEVFDSTFTPVSPAGRFLDPALPAGYAPFNVQQLEGGIYVTYAIRNTTTGAETSGSGLGVVNRFDLDGNLIERIATGSLLNAPWGLAIAPSDFGPLSNMLLVGNFGDGRITAYDANHRIAGQLVAPNGGPIVIEGLWGMTFGDDVVGSHNALYFTAGPGDETHGMFGRIEVTTDLLVID